jgi:thioredoxin-like negative regulator of GroEL
MASKSPNKDQLYRMGVEAAKKGQKQPARMMFQQVLQQDKRHLQAMMWMAKVAATPEERAQWLRRVLKLDPKNANAKKALGKMETRDEATRNKRFFRIGAVVYVIVVIVLSFLSILIFT